MFEKIFSFNVLNERKIKRKVIIGQNFFRFSLNHL